MPKKPKKAKSANKAKKTAKKAKPVKKPKAKAKAKPAKKAVKKAVAKKPAKKAAAKPASKPKASAKPSAKPSKPAPKDQKPAAPVQQAPQKPAGAIGRVVHYYDRIQVAIVLLSGKLVVGDKIVFKRGEREFTQKIKSIQVQHKPLQSASSGQVVGLKVDSVAPEGSWLIK